MLKNPIKRVEIEPGSNLVRVGFSEFTYHLELEDNIVNLNKLEFDKLAQEHKVVTKFNLVGKKK